jgi:uroporphyrin-III C-methyltransferase/precorrin-2 dehydrogenase/sirohydrochlorin ferrochelatase
VDYLPVFLSLRGRQVLVVGGGKVALRKSELLARAGACIDVVALEALPELAALALAGGGRVRLEAFCPEHVVAQSLVLSATGVDAVDRSVHAAARALRIPVNVADVPELCDFILPSILDRSPVIAAFSTGGRAPVLARKIRAQLETLLPEGIGRLADWLGSRRERIRAAQPDPLLRLRVWERLVDGPLAERVFAGDEEAAESLLADELACATSGGEVYLVGAGPGDPDLLSFRAFRLMQRADVVLHDRLVSDAVLDLVRRDAERIYVGKRRGEHAVPQPDINQLLVDLARAGKRVLRLKGGDPFIFGRGGEEIEQLAAEGIPFQVVPGISAANGCAAYAGIPLTHRDHAQSVRFIAGHLRDGSVALDWASLLQPRETLVFYMGRVGLPQICERLIAHGADPATPLALVQQGTLPEQRVLVSTLRDMPAVLALADIRGPTLTIVGSVVSLHQQLSWFRSPPRTSHE